MLVFFTDPMLPPTTRHLSGRRDRVVEQLLDREPIFHRPHLGTTREDYEAQTADDFWEVGSSGPSDRDDVINTLVQRGKVPTTSTGLSPMRAAGILALATTRSPTSSTRLAGSLEEEIGGRGASATTAVLSLVL